jgi:hypothetical protein
VSAVSKHEDHRETLISNGIYTLPRFVSLNSLPTAVYRSVQKYVHVLLPGRRSSVEHSVGAGCTGDVCPVFCLVPQLIFPPLRVTHITLYSGL